MILLRDTVHNGRTYAGGVLIYSIKYNPWVPIVSMVVNDFDFFDLLGVCVTTELELDPSLADLYLPTFIQSSMITESPSMKKPAFEMRFSCG